MSEWKPGEWHTVVIPVPIGLARQIVDGSLDPLTEQAFLGFQPSMFAVDSYSGRDSMALVQIEVPPTKDQIVNAGSMDCPQCGLRIAGRSFRLLSASVLKKGRSAKILRAGDSPKIPPSA